jgi:hypothetical protein
VNESSLHNYIKLAYRCVVSFCSRARLRVLLHLALPLGLTPTRRKARPLSLVLCWQCCRGDGGHLLLYFRLYTPRHRYK